MWGDSVRYSVFKNSFVERRYRYVIVLTYHNRKENQINISAPNSETNESTWIKLIRILQKWLYN